MHQSDDYKKILDEIHNKKAQLIDVREQAEWEASRFQCAMHIPLSELMAGGKGIEKLRAIKAEDKNIYLHCRSGSRVKMAKMLLARYGCTQIDIIPVSIMKMIEEGFQFTR